jgi:hypothetical protein
MSFSIDLRDKNKKLSNWGRHLANAGIAARDFAINAYGQTNPRLRGAEQVYQDTKGKGKIPDYFQASKRQRLNSRGASKPSFKPEASTSGTKTDKETMPRSYARTAGPRGKSRKYRLSKRRRRYTKKKNKFSTKGFRTYQQNYFAFDANNDIIKPGFEDGSDYHNAFFVPACDQSLYTQGWRAVPSTLATTDPFNLIYARVRGRLSNFISSSNMSTQFTKFRVNWIKHTWYFPDQAADTTNDKWPLVLWINNKDIKHINIDGYGEQATWPTRDQLIERPGWKRIVLKRQNKFTFKFRPHLRKVDEYGTTLGNEVDKNKLVPMKFMGVDDVGTQSISYYGPTIAIEMPEAALYGNGTTTNDCMKAFTGNAGTFDGTGTRAPVSFLNYTTVKVSASVSFKDPDNEATRGIIP